MKKAYKEGWLTYMDIVSLHKVKKHYGQGGNVVKALDGVSLSVGKGKFLAVLGSSGSGKTTLLNMIGGLDRPDSGSVIVEGTDMASLNETQATVFRRNRIGFIQQDFNLFGTFTILENILLPLTLGNTSPDKDFLEEILAVFKLSDKKDAYPADLSGGGQQRTAIARALITKPSIILADEPTGNLDSRSSQNVLGLLKQSAELYHQTLIMITHNKEIAQLADEIAFIEDGMIKVALC